MERNRVCGDVLNGHSYWVCNGGYSVTGVRQEVWRCSERAHLLRQYWRVYCEWSNTENVENF
jgi:hypothetical protein